MAAASDQDQDRNYYAILGVESTATDEEIKLAYRRLSVKFHEVSPSYNLKAIGTWLLTV